MKQAYKPNISRLFIAFSLLLLGTLTSFAQVSSTYTFTSSSGTYTPITGGTVLSTASDDDVSYPVQNIGFTFNYNGQSFTTVGVQSNGHITLGGAAINSYGALSASPNTIAGLNGDLQGKGMGTSDVRIQTLGSAPNRVCVIQWRDWTRWQAVNFPNDTFNFQIRLNETGAVQIVYGAIAYGSTGVGGFTTNVGINGSLVTDFNARTGTSFAASTAATANTQGITGSTTNIPVSGLTYTWQQAPMTFDSASTFQIASGVPSGSTNQAIINVKVYT
ncbi:MAG: hypothetical protein ACK5XN_36320, partial [Bacteroidota bacterium]